MLSLSLPILIGVTWILIPSAIEFVAPQRSRFTRRRAAAFFTLSLAESLG